MAFLMHSRGCPTDVQAFALRDPRNSRDFLRIKKARIFKLTYWCELCMKQPGGTGTVQQTQQEPASVFKDKHNGLLTEYKHC